MVLMPENMSSSQLDELSCLTYISYFVNVNGPAAQATLQKVQRLLPQVLVKNFTVTFA